MNIVIFMGNLTRDPEMRYTPTGKAVTSFTVAINEGFGETRKTFYINCVAWEKSAESVAERARKGSRVVVEGKLTQDSYTNKEGRKVERMTVTARTVTVLNPVEQQEAFGKARRAEPQKDDELDELPF